MSTNKSGFIQALKLRISGSKGWYTATCVFCNKRDKLGVLLDPFNTDVKPHFHCFKCGRAGSLSFLAKHIGRPELSSDEYIAPMDIGMQIEEPTEAVELPECKLPIGFRRVYDHQYLSFRQISDNQKNLYKFGTTRIDTKVGSDYIIIAVEEDARCVGYVARSIMSKEWIDEYNATHDDEYPRYKNSESDFAKIVAGIDEIVIGKTVTVIVVEGLFDKMAVDRKMRFNESDEVKCACTFGTKLSDTQARKIASKGVQNVVILYDAGTVDKSKKVSKTASSFFNTVSVGSLTNGDPDEIEWSELAEAIAKSKSVTEYSLSELNDFDL